VAVGGGRWRSVEVGGASWSHEPSAELIFVEGVGGRDK
jgi:hypothetical protein